MCGISGFIYKGDSNLSLLKRMNDSIAYRGPDDSGEFLADYDENYKIGLAHRRLSIVDLSPLGHQPMFSPDEQVVVVFNGEVYNFKDVRKTLTQKGYTFKSDTDTEVIIQAYLEWGIDFINHMNGMFAIALYDKRTDDFYLIRDRMGVKPLYYYENEKGLIFGSELKPIMVHPDFKKVLDLHALSLFLYHGYITAPHTIFKNTYKLKPGSYLHFNKGVIQHHTYWSVQDKFEQRQIKEQSEKDAVHDLDTVLTASIKDRMISDVPLGAFLSGGIDSSLVVALMQKQSTQPIKTFTIGFDEPAFNEAPYAKEIAAHLGTDHHELYLPIKKAEELIPKIPEYYDEPFADASQLPTMLVSQMAKQKVTVALSGDGGDELYCGYGRYDDVLRLQKFIPYAKIANKIPFFKCFVSMLTKNSKYKQFFELTHNHNVINSAYLNFIHNFPLIKNHTHKFNNAYEDIMQATDNLQEKNMLQDMVTYLPDDILTKVDRASMAYSLESRPPFIDDHRVVEHSFTIPHDMKYKDGNKKYILKKVLENYIPKKMIDRPKMGFGIPIYDWLRDDLQYLIHDYLSVDYIEKQGVFNVKEIQCLTECFFKESGHSTCLKIKKKIFGDKFKLHKDGYVERTIWHLIVFQLWHARYMKEESYS
ncbi:MAG: asparagine synthase (glutamine-hydrolyzing) [Alphaproteobacteria bacterium CG_4_10_14_0_8_um_filter_37_21]|nr:MAG: asparagine synthase (glutamine-hydrolyzing) [Alphaproteobacteria bacterium CG_4_10_14_0_8_um_filter_37_21]